MSNCETVKAVRELKGLWPERDSVINGYFANSSCLYKLAVKGLQTGIICSFEQFQRNLENLQNKPKFEDHPDAKCFVQDHLGQWFKNTLTADVWAGKDFASWVSGAFPSWVSISKGEVIGEWRHTLTLPPAKIEVAFKSSKLRRLEVGEDLTAAQERTGKPIVSEVSTTNEADLWFLNKELPPAGTECLYVGSPFKPPQKAYIVAHHMDDKRAIWSAVSFTTGKLMYGKAEHFRPIQSDRENFIEAVSKAIGTPQPSYGLAQFIAEKMFDSGEFFYKPKDNNNGT